MGEHVVAAIGTRLDEETVAVGIVEFGETKIEAVSGPRAPTDRRAPARRRRHAAGDGDDEDTTAAGGVSRVG